MDLESYTPYISALIGATIAIIGWVAVHHLNKQKSKEERFITTLERQLTQINIHLMLEIENIFAEANKDVMSKKFIDFMNIIESIDSPMNIESNPKTIDSFKNLRSEYLNYKKASQEERDLELLLVRLHIFYDHLSSNLQERQEVVFKNHDWLLKISKMGPTAKIIFILFNSLFNIISVITNFLLLTTVFEISTLLISKIHEKIIGTKEFTQFASTYAAILKIFPHVVVFSVLAVMTWFLFFAYNCMIFKIKTKNIILRKMVEKEDDARIRDYREKHPLPEYLKIIKVSEDNE